MIRSRWRYIVIHHSFTRDEHTTKNWDAIRKYHKEVKGWADIGYHFGVEMSQGELCVMKGRPLTRTGAHARGFNANGIGICLVGNYDIEPPSDDRLALLRALVSDLMAEHGIPVDNVIGHRETYALLTPPVQAEKTCPGASFDLDEFRDSLTDSKGKQ